MNRNALKSIGAVLAGFVATFALSYGTDGILRLIGVLPGALPMYGSELQIITVIIYRTIYNVAGAYIAARLAPNHPMRHALVLGSVGFVLSILVTAVTWNTNLGPAWYSISIIVLALPSAWLGGKLRLKFDSI